MNVFQLDENISSKRFARHCEERHNCQINVFPPERRGQKDSMWIPDLLEFGRPTILTLDRTIVVEHARRIPERNSGIVIVRKIDPIPPLTLDRASEIVALFKQRFPEWSRISYSNLCLEICEISVGAGLLRSDGIFHEKNFTLDHPNFRRQLRDHIKYLVGTALPSVEKKRRSREL